MADFYAIYNVILKVNGCQSQNEMKRYNSERILIISKCKEVEIV